MVPLYELLQLWEHQALQLLKHVLRMTTESTEPSDSQAEAALLKEKASGCKVRSLDEDMPPRAKP